MKKIVNLLLVLGIIGTLALSFVPQPVSAMTGSGTEGDPYMIYDVDDLQDMANNLTAHYELANDIDASVTSGWNGGAGFDPVGESLNYFSGYFDGNGYTISGLYINRPSTDYVGLFGWIEGEGALQNINFVNPDITGSDQVGVLVGCVGGVYDIFNINVGGGDVTGTSFVGGLAGHLVMLWYDPYQVYCSYCYYTGEVYGESTVGGLVGAILGAAGTNFAQVEIYRCAVSAYVYGPDSRVGGLVGHCNGHITESCSYGLVQGSSAGWEGVGGLVGRGGGDIQDCYSRCSVAAGSGLYGDYVGGLTGRSNVDPMAVDNSYCTGDIGSAKYWGGMVPVEGAYGTWTDCFWDTESSGQPTSGRGTGKTTVQMQTQSTFTDAGWDFDTIWSIGGAINNGYPYFDWWYDPYDWPGDFYQVLWFQPNDIIEGTTLPDRVGTEDGIITWGSNPAGVSVELTGFYSDYAPANITLPQDIVNPQDMIGPTGNPGHTREVGTLTGNPFYPIVKALSDNSGIPVQLWWIILASIIILIVMVVTYKYLPHQIITALAAGGLSAFFYGMGIYPFWVPLIFAVMALAIVLGERSPTV